MRVLRYVTSMDHLVRVAQKADRSECFAVQTSKDRERLASFARSEIRSIVDKAIQNELHSSKKKYF